ncbi:TetR/AcrR family transcriptional regulator, partial [Bacillus haynesii]|nr:TetR/AcrR family transcriptional regulator [Bacillus haynesii]
VEKNEVIPDINVRWTARTIINFVENIAERYYIGAEKDEEISVFKKEIYTFLKRSIG